MKKYKIKEYYIKIDLATIGKKSVEDVLVDLSKLIKDKNILFFDKRKDEFIFLSYKYGNGILNLDVEVGIFRYLLYKILGPENQMKFKYWLNKTVNLIRYS